MNENHSDALVFLGATGDLAYKKIFPSLQAMIKRGQSPTMYEGYDLKSNYCGYGSARTSRSASA